MPDSASPLALDDLFGLAGKVTVVTEGTRISPAMSEKPVSGRFVHRWGRSDMLGR
jgi:hypothetical protein